MASSDMSGSRLMNQVTTLRRLRPRSERKRSADHACDAAHRRHSSEEQADRGPVAAIVIVSVIHIRALD
jgi:hypothetical protein